MHSADRSLALVMIVRDEARCIQRCLRSAAPHVDRMLVLDTGSQDDTVALARSCGAQVHEMVWPDSFSVARNHALDLADADWNLILDADEWIEEGGAELRKMLVSAPGLGVLRIESECTAGHFNSVAGDWITRLLPRGVFYAGAIHEQPVSNLPRRRLPVVIGHDGYSKDAMQAKCGRNRALLRAELAAADGEDPYLLFQLGRDFEVYGELSPAADQYLRAMAVLTDEVAYRPDLIVRAMHCLGKSGRFEQAMALASDAMTELDRSPDYHFTLGDLFLDGAVAHPGEALSQWLPMAEAAWLRCLEIGDRPDLAGHVAGRGSFLAAHNLHVVYEGLGDQARSACYRDLSERLRPASQQAAH